MNGGFIPKHGGYRRLLSYQKAELIYDLTFKFCERFLSRRDRTVDQMVQAARSGKQNIGEGSAAAGNSTETEIKLTSVARASLEELRLDYEDFLRSRGLPIWSATSREALFVRRLGSRGTEGDDRFRALCASRGADVAANIVLCLIHQATYLLDRQIARLEKDFVQKGGIRERMTRARLQARSRH